MASFLFFRTASWPLDALEYTTTLAPACKNILHGHYSNGERVSEYDMSRSTVLHDKGVLASLTVNVKK